MNTLIKNKLYVVATPIGNLNDITFRAVEVLSGSDVILCEDTRITSVLLSHLNIDKKKLIVVNKDINKSSFSKIIDIIKNNVVSIVSDSGTPNLSDPASVIIDLCYNNDIPVEAIPGPSSIMAFYSSFPFGTRFMFYGFIDKISQQITEVIDLSRKIDSPVIIFVSPSKIEKFLHELSLKDADADVYLSKELTKVHEFKKIFKAKDYEILFHFENFKINKGEYCLAIRSSNVSHNLTDLNSFILDNISLKTKELAQIVSDKFSISNSDAYYHVLAVKKNIQ